MYLGFRVIRVTVSIGGRPPGLGLGFGLGPVPNDREGTFMGSCFFSQLQKWSSLVYNCL